ncbi:uncharacterized protein LOC132726324 [Ruditapes philippinarum]|uniref:uncharacterized protein LOC132726324 n=1 Tax=Ruditapes philippinarum TaxID=129788 RepID=UPI00295B9C98|nr:uncharacterized protein LOC132726324 [Ruditapes philippinarum]
MPKYSAYVYVVLTKYDLVKDENSFKWSSNEPKVTFEEFREIEKEIEQRFSIEGSLEDNRTRWVSYTDATGKDNPYIDNIALKFIKRMLMVRNDKVKSVKTVMSTWTLMNLNMKRYWQNAKRSLEERQFTISLGTLAMGIVFGIFALAMLCKVYIMLKAPPSGHSRDREYY